MEMLPAAFFEKRSGCKLNSVENMMREDKMVSDLIMVAISWHGAEIEALSVPSVVASRLT
jgi:hypothetical protein